MIRDKTSKGPPPSGAHLVKLRDYISSLPNWIATLPEEVQASITSRWDVGKFKGFAGNFDEAACVILRNSSDVEFFEEDRIGHAAAIADSSVTIHP
ncbi:hypothetical protein M378DRAFT_159732 [Amanita muscaria Koide BX008]|uniref:Uncharacterized protein n=1 Tax=Amanita muscaria (strain Koide BX008) TaxID=946122 RepID=A0A0C2WZQ3_AMAMK|nr:hypothetical protein M378DRAFT_159732 [Amanita muscaria Koide BX008]